VQSCVDKLDEYILNKELLLMDEDFDTNLARQLDSSDLDILVEVLRRVNKDCDMRNELQRVLGLPYKELDKQLMLVFVDGEDER